MRVLLLAGMVALAACELTEVTTADPERFVVAEVVLQAGADTQFAYLHASLGEPGLRVSGARVQVFEEGGADTLVYRETEPQRCLSPYPENEGLVGSCYVAAGAGQAVVPGGSYRLQIELPGGGRLTGRTRVPGAVQLLQPAAALCRLPPDTTLDLRWRAAEGAWVYAVELQLNDIFPILVARGVVPDTPNVPLRLGGLAVSAADTTLSIPDELGIFDRFDADLHPVLVALRGGLPEGVTGAAVVAATDRNYVNWARGGSFNPSGLVRVPSVGGAGTGVFGSLTAAHFRLRVTREPGLPSCL